MQTSLTSAWHCSPGASANLRTPGTPLTSDCQVLCAGVSWPWVPGCLRTMTCDNTHGIAGQPRARTREGHSLGMRRPRPGFHRCRMKVPDHTGRMRARAGRLCVARWGARFYRAACSVVATARLLAAARTQVWRRGDVSLWHEALRTSTLCSTSLPLAGARLHKTSALARLPSSLSLHPEQVTSLLLSCMYAARVFRLACHC